jgi:hypothetical protein
MKAIVISVVLTLALAVAGAAWKWSSFGHSPSHAKAVGWTWEAPVVDDDGGSASDGWTW